MPLALQISSSENAILLVPIIHVYLHLHKSVDFATLHCVASKHIEVFSKSNVQTHFSTPWNMYLRHRECYTILYNFIALPVLNNSLFFLFLLLFFLPFIPAVLSSRKINKPVFIDPFNKYRIRNFHPMTSNSFQLRL